MRKPHGEAPGVQELALEAALLAALAIHRVANDRESRVRQVRPDLMRAPGDRSDVQKGPTLGTCGPGRNALETGRGLAPAGTHDHAAPVTRIAKKRRLDDGGGAAGITPHERDILLAELLRLDLPGEREVSGVVLRDDENTARVFVEPVHDPGPRRRTTGIGRDPSNDR